MLHTDALYLPPVLPVNCRKSSVCLNHANPLKSPPQLHKFTLYFKILILDYRTSSQTPKIMDERLWTLSPDAHSMCNIFKSVHSPVLKLSYSVCFCSHFPSSLSRSHWVFRAVRNPTTLLKWSEAAAQLSGQTAMQVKGRLQPRGQVS